MKIDYTCRNALLESLDDFSVVFVSADDYFPGAFVVVKLLFSYYLVFTVVVVTVHTPLTTHPPLAATKVREPMHLEATGVVWPGRQIQNLGNS